MSDLRDLYQEVILDHSKSPRNFREISDASCSANGYNPLCGDKIKVFLRTEGDTIEDAAFNGSGCAISMAAASMMTQAARGATRDQIERKFQTYHALVTGKTDPDAAGAELGKLAIFAGVSRFPVRVKCATLCWHTLRAALKQQEASVTTE